MRRHSLWFLALLALVLVAMGRLARPVAAAPTTTVGDDLRDVVDDEADEDWLSWGGELEEQNEVDEASPQMVFVQLKPKEEREEEDSQKLAHKFRSWLRLGGFEETVFPVSDERLFVSIRYNRDMAEYMKLFLTHEDVRYFAVNRVTFVWDEDEEKAVVSGHLNEDPFTMTPPAQDETTKKKKKKKKKKAKGKSEL